MSVTSAPAAFVIPHWTSDLGRSQRHLDATLNAITRQTDSKWQIVLIDDASPDPAAQLYLRQLQQWLDRLHVIFNARNVGAGPCRNQGVAWAQTQGLPIVLFNDSDDLSHHRRLEVIRQVFVEQPKAAVVYSTFQVIDQDGLLVPLEAMTASVAEVLEAHRYSPPQGDAVWITIGTQTGYINHTSSTAVRTDLAMQFPFPAERVSEDSHTWLRYSAGGGHFVYIDQPLSSYRTTRTLAGSSSREREGGKHGFYTTKARVDAEGFQEAMRIALARKTISADQQEALLVAFYLRLSQTLAREGELQLANEQVKKAQDISPDLTSQGIIDRGLSKQVWTKA